MDDVIRQIEQYCQKKHIDHRFVGGVSFGGLLNSKTTWEIHIQKKTISLQNANQISLLRSDKTKRDIDMILFCPDAKKIQGLRQFIQQNKFDTVTIEPAIYFPKKINKLLQFVTTIFVDKNNQPFLTFGSVEQKISWKSLEQWTVITKENSYTVRNPIADYFAYQLRSPSGTKPKDNNKIILLKHLAHDMVTIGRKNNIDYLSNDYFGSWKIFLKNLQTSTDISISTKRIFMKFYWNTIGTTLAHGGNITKIFFPLHNKFTG